MTITRKEIRKFLNKKIAHLNDIIADIDALLSRLETEYYRVAIFGSARIAPDSSSYKDVYELAFQLAMRGVDIVTGGGPGLMDAANKGAKEGGQHSRSIGLPIVLPYETDTNAHLDVKREHRRFSSRLDEFMRISQAVVVTPGGVGTLLEFIYTWQLMQVKHIPARPILLLGGDKMWPQFLQWMKRWSLEQNLMNKDDFSNISFCKSIQDVIIKLEPDIKRFQSQAKNSAETIR